MLDRKHTGLVFGLDARIHVAVQSSPREATNATGSGEGSRGRRVLVRSPQFKEAKWQYEVLMEAGKGVSVKQVGDEESNAAGLKPNKFVETALRYAFTYLSYAEVRSREGDGMGLQSEEPDLVVTILADDDYYSSSSSEPKANVSEHVAGMDGSRVNFSDFGVRLSDAHKTGLGSSAALTTALVGALLEFYGQDTASLAQKPQSDLDRRKSVIHILAQAAHCAAQGKVGSGFDVAAAVYGSCLYRRFSPEVLEQVGEPGSGDFSERLYRCVEDDFADGKGKAWDVDIMADKVQVPDSLLLMLCDVDCGSETPGMVRKMLKWRETGGAESAAIWDELQRYQEGLCAELAGLSDLSSKHSSEGSFETLRTLIADMRKSVRKMTASSGVPVEPEVITELLDHCSRVDGVVGGVAPGAGGYDAVALLLRNEHAVVENLQRSLVGWKSKKDGAEIGNVRLLDVKQASEGMREEDAGEQRYKAWLQ